jgi:pSer/pThr/pTyr-binding forkhead associated (FHA) protein
VTERPVELVVARNGHVDRRVALPAGAFCIGRAEDNDVVLPDIGVSRRHARLHVTADGVVVEDLGSGNGTYFRGKRVHRQVLGHGDAVVIDPFTLTVESGAEEVAEVVDAAGGQDATAQLAGSPAILVITASQRMAPRNFPLPSEGVVTMGRSERNPIVLAEPAASRVHAEIVCANGHFVLRDRNSSNGTWVNGRRIRERTLEDGDQIRIGTVEMRYRAASSGEAEGTEQFDGNLHEDQAALRGAVVPPPPTLPVPVAPSGPASSPTTVLQPPTAFAPPPARLAPAVPLNTGVELDVAPGRTRPRAGGKLKVRRQRSFLLRPINLISFGLLAFTMFILGARVLYDLVAPALTRSSAPAAPVAAPAPAATTTPAAAPRTPSAEARQLDPADQAQVQKRMAEGMRLFGEGKHFEAAAQFYTVLQLDPGNPDAERMGYVSCEFIAFGKLRAALEERSASAGERAAAKKAALEAVAAALDGRLALADAGQKLETAEKLNASDADLATARASLEQQESVNARAASRASSERKQKSLQQLVDAGQSSFDRGNYGDAVQSWSQVVAQDVTRSTPQYYQAEEGIRAAKDRMSEQGKKSYQAALQAMKSGDMLTARTQLQATVRVDPYNDGAQAKLREVKQRLKDQASDVYKEARANEEIRQTEKALALYQKVITYVGDESDPLAQKAQQRMNALLQ